MPRSNWGAVQSWEADPEDDSEDSVEVIPHHTATVTHIEPLPYCWPRQPEATDDYDRKSKKKKKMKDLKKAPAAPIKKKEVKRKGRRDNNKSPYKVPKELRYSQKDHSPSESEEEDTWQTEHYLLNSSDDTDYEEEEIDTPEEEEESDMDLDNEEEIDLVVTHNPKKRDRTQMMKKRAVRFLDEEPEPLGGKWSRSKGKENQTPAIVLDFEDETAMLLPDEDEASQRLEEERPKWEEQTPEKETAQVRVSQSNEKLEQSLRRALHEMERAYTTCPNLEPWIVPRMEKMRKMIRDLSGHLKTAK